MLHGILLICCMKADMLHDAAQLDQAFEREQDMQGQVMVADDRTRDIYQRLQDMHVRLKCEMDAQHRLEHQVSMLRQAHGVRRPQV